LEFRTESGSKQVSGQCLWSVLDFHSTVTNC
jgi:hypothetical protein